jgi:hypothetical protein
MSYTILYQDDAAGDVAETVHVNLSAAVRALAKRHNVHASEIELDDRSSSCRTVEQYSVRLSGIARQVATITNDDADSIVCSTTENGQYGLYKIGVEYCKVLGVHHIVKRPQHCGTGETEWRILENGEWVPILEPRNPPLVGLPDEEHGHTWGADHVRCGAPADILRRRIPDATDTVPRTATVYALALNHGGVRRYGYGLWPSGFPGEVVAVMTDNGSGSMEADIRSALTVTVLDAQHAGAIEIAVTDHVWCVLDRIQAASVEA